jgi:ABC-type microcin C transport system duplicated ATPase subunit YejF
MTKPVLRVQDLAVTITSFTGGLLQRQERQLRAVDGISFELYAGETLGVVGESGSGKSTLARAILGLITPDRGRVMWRGEELTGLDEEELRQKRKELQIVFQDPVASLDPRMTAGDIIADCCLTRSTDIPMNFPADSVSVLVLHAPWYSIPGCWSATNRSVRWMYRSRPRSSTCCRIYRKNWAWR